MVYFDHNATSPLHPAARDAWLAAAEQYLGNPSSPHRLGSRAEVALSNAREKLAEFLWCSPLDIVWTSGASESSNTVFHHLAASLPSDAQVWISAIEHSCVHAAARHYFESRVRLLPVGRGGVVDLDHLQRELKNGRPGLVAVLAVNNETGVIQPWREVQSLCSEYEVPFFCDAVQAFGKLPAAGLGRCDFVSGSAHKFGGPRGVGFLKCPRGRVTEPLIYGGPQEDGRRAGTENVAGVLAMLAALGIRETDLKEGQHAKREAWRTKFESLLANQLPGSVVLGAGQARVWNTVAAVMPEGDCRQRWVVKLDRLGFAVSTGSACASGKETPSHVLAAMGYTPTEAGRVLRFSSGWETTWDEWNSLLEALAALSPAARP